MHNTLVILLTKILIVTKRTFLIITSHSYHQWIFCLRKTMMTLLVYIESQNITWIHIEKGVSTCPTKELFINMANILSAVKEGLQSYCNKVYSHRSFNQMLILKYRKDILESLNSRFYSRKFHLLNKCTSTIDKLSLLKMYNRA